MIKLEKISIKKIEINNMSQLKLTREALFPGYEAEIT